MHTGSLLDRLSSRCSQAKPRDWAVLFRETGQKILGFGLTYFAPDFRSAMLGNSVI